MFQANTTEIDRFNNVVIGVFEYQITQFTCKVPRGEFLYPNFAHRPNRTRGTQRVVRGHYTRNNILNRDV